MTPETKAEMKRVLTDIQSGKFTRDWMLENRVNQTSFKATRAKAASHQIEEVGAKLRGMMPWIGANKLVDKEKNWTNLHARHLRLTSASDGARRPYEAHCHI